MTKFVRFVLILSVGLLSVSSCRQDMHDQPNYTPLERSDFFDDGSSSRLPVEGTVARGSLRTDPHFDTGKAGEVFVATFPFEIDAAELDRGQELFNVFCSPCHDRLGSGNGMIVQRGFRRPTSFHVERLRDQPVGYLFDVVTNGFGAMPSYAGQIEAGDRWKIVAYLRALQLSQNATQEDLTAEQRQSLQSGGGQR